MKGGKSMEVRYLLTRKEAAERYNISLRQLDALMKRNQDFPVVRIGGRVLIHRDRADEWITGWIGAEIAV